MSENLHKSDEGWSRFRERTDSGSRARRAHMEHRPRRSVSLHKVSQPPPAPLDAVPDIEAVSACGLCSIRCTGACDDPDE